MAASAGFAEFLRELLAPLGPIGLRRMFGATGVFRDGLMFAIVADDTLYFRVDDTNRATFQQAASLPPLTYMRMGRMIDLPFWPAPERLLDDSEELVIWARAALGAASRVAAARKRPAPGRKSRKK